MDDTRRFLRYVIPGSLYAVEIIFCMLIVFPEETVDYIKSAVATKDSLGVALGGIVASGALGYLFAALHHWCHWVFNDDFADHTKIVKQLMPQEESVHRKEAFEIVSALWYKKVATDSKNGEILDKKFIAMTDLTHGLGAAWVASLSALITAIWICCNFATFDPNCKSFFRFGLMVMFGGFLAWMFHNSYMRVGKLTQGYLERVLTDVFKANLPDTDAERKAKNPPESNEKAPSDEG